MKDWSALPLGVLWQLLCRNAKRLDYEGDKSLIELSKNCFPRLASPFSRGYPIHWKINRHVCFSRGLPA